MNTETKISPAFRPFLADSGTKDKCDAIVIYEVPLLEEVRVRGRLREIKKRLDFVKERAAIQQRVGQEILESYRRAGSERLGGTDHLEVSTIGSSALPIATVEVTRDTLQTLADQPNVVAILPNQRIELIQPKHISYELLSRHEVAAGFTWGLEQLDVPRLWASTRGAYINVAVLDTGVYSKHPALADRVLDFVVIDPLGNRITTSSPFDSSRHGTHVCGIIAGGQTAEGIAIGVAPEARLLVGAVLVGNATLRTLMEGISWAIEKGADIINMSLGFSYYEPLFTKVFSILIDQYGVLPVVAIGNNNHGNSCSPGNAHSAFSVGAVEKLPGETVDVAFYSGGAALVFPGEEPDALVIKPDVVAPGSQIFSCIPPEKQPNGTYEYTYMDGTSMATPYVSGIAALLMSANPEIPVRELIRVLKCTAKHPSGDAHRPDNRWGYGLIQPVEAMKALDCDVR